VAGRWRRGGGRPLEEVRRWPAAGGGAAEGGGAAAGGRGIRVVGGAPGFIQESRWADGPAS
jgi:hypothetical protein